MNIVAVLSMLHEEPLRNSATRSFRGQSVLWWTLARLAGARGVRSTVVLCWSDQQEAVAACVGQAAVKVSARGERRPIVSLDGVAAAARWLDGWRGGLLQTCDFDRGFHAAWTADVAKSESADAVLLVDPSSGLVDPHLIDTLVAHAVAHPAQELVFSPAAPGLGAPLVRPPLLERLAATQGHPGRLLAYVQDRPCGEPLARECCAPVPTPVARTTRRFKLDSERQIRRLSTETESLNGQLIRTSAEQLVARASADTDVDPLPREVVLELTTRRSTRPIWWAGRHLAIDRPDLPLDLAERLFAELAPLEDTRVTLAGVGDPLLHPRLPDVLAAARAAGLRAVHVETDLAGVGHEHLDALVTSAAVDVVSIHMPAVTQETYARVMGIDAYLDVLENLKRLVTGRHSQGSGTPILVPTFVKCRDNLAEMELWYDQWLRVLGSAVIAGPSTCAGQIPDVAVADMSGPRRRPCPRLASRMTVLSDGRVAICEQDVLGAHTVGTVGDVPITEIWRGRLAAIRDDHARANWSAYPLCGKCTEWHRP